MSGVVASSEGSCPSDQAAASRTSSDGSFSAVTSIAVWGAVAAPRSPMARSSVGVAGCAAGSCGAVVPSFARMMVSMPRL